MNNSATAEFCTDIAIVGGGMVGITAALMLQQALPKLRITLLEHFDLTAKQNFQPSFDQRATAIAAGSLAVLAPLQIEQALALHSGVIERVQVSDKGHWGQVTIDAAEHGLAHVGMVVPNALLGQVLLQKLQQQDSIATLAPVQVEKLTPIIGGYQITIAAREPLRARLVILADGAQSSLKQKIGITQQRTDYQQQAAIANVRLSRPHKNNAYERFTASGPMALLPLADAHTMALVWTLPADAEVADLSDEEFAARAQLQFGDFVGEFEKIGKRDIYPLALVQATEQLRSHLMLLGNAAHFLHPVAGQGFNLSVRDIAALVKTLRKNLQQTGIEGLGQLAQLQCYLEERSMDQWLTTQYSHQLVKWFSSNKLLNIIPRQLGLMGLNALPPLRQLLAEQSMGRVINYER